MNLNKLSDVFPENDIEWRIHSSGIKNGKPWAKVLAYITNRAIIERLNSVCGKEKWKNDFKPWHEFMEIKFKDSYDRSRTITLPVNSNYTQLLIDKNIYSIKTIQSQLCGISIKVDNEWITKWDGAECSDFEPIKGGISNSQKRAAVEWGIGTYLYGLTDNWAKFDGPTKYRSNIDGKWLDWGPPSLPEWALPKEDKNATF